MTDPTIGLKLPKSSESPGGPASMSAGDWGRRAEELGYDSVWTSEGWGSDAFLDLAEAALRTDRIRLCTAIANAYSRSPATLAMASATLQRLSDGRAILGIGASHPDLIEGLHSMAYERPVRRVHETIELVKRFTGEDGEVDYGGELFDVSGFRGFGTEVPIYNAALGEANRRATGRVADGWLPYLLPLSKLPEAFETVADAAEVAGRDPGGIAVAPQVLAAVSDDPEAAREEVRRYAARYFGAMANYRNALAQWYPAEAEAIGEAWEAGDREEARARVTDELVDELGVAGTPEAARERLRELADSATIDCPIVYVPNSTPADVRDRTIEALSPREL